MEFKYLLEQINFFFLSWFVSHKHQGRVNKEIQVGTSVMSPKVEFSKILF